MDAAALHRDALVLDAIVDTSTLLCTARSGSKSETAGGGSTYPVCATAATRPVFYVFSRNRLTLTLPT